MRTKAGHSEQRTTREGGTVFLAPRCSLRQARIATRRIRSLALFVLDSNLSILRSFRFPSHFHQIATQEDFARPRRSVIGSPSSRARACSKQAVRSLTRLAEPLQKAEANADNQRAACTFESRLLW
jgi:hypothetical protein